MGDRGGAGGQVREEEHVPQKSPKKKGRATGTVGSPREVGPGKVTDFYAESLCDSAKRSSVKDKGSSFQYGSPPHRGMEHAQCGRTPVEMGCLCKAHQSLMF